MKEQICNKCLEKKCISEFEWQKNRPNPRKTCKKCRNKANWNEIKSNPEKHKKFLDNRNDHRNKNKDIYKSRWMKSVYGITLKEFKDLINLQEDKCLICNEPLKSSKTTHLDHDHKTGKIRGVLCSKCNTGLGMFRDDPKILESAIKYLNK